VDFLVDEFGSFLSEIQAFCHFLASEQARLRARGLAMTPYNWAATKTARSTQR
jgi:hypothetical protein